MNHCLIVGKGFKYPVNLIRSVVSGSLQLAVGVLIYNVKSQFKVECCYFRFLRCSIL